MAKVKNKKNANLADRVHNKKKAEANKKKLNPFEVHINREKLKVLGKKSKHDRGLPGVSRAKAIQKRKETLGTEMKLINKTNTFIDRRIGEKNNQLSTEDRMIARFAAERAKQHSKKNIYNLADDEILTHRGQTLEQIEKFDDPRSSDDEEDEKRFGGLGGEFVSEGHFGGGMLSKSESKDGAKSHKDLIEQLIAESKKRKAEKQKEKEQTLDLTEKLDSEWKDLQPVVFKQQKKEESIIDKLLSKAETGLDYDKTMRELRFEKRGTPSDGLKSKEKQDEEERKKIEELERQREERMVPEEIVTARNCTLHQANQPTPKHRSADDLDDNFELDDEKEFMLAYDNEGKPLVPEHVLKDYSVPNAKKKFEDGVSDTSDEEDNDESNDDSDEDNNEKNSDVSNENESEEESEDDEEKNNTENGKVDESSDDEESTDDESSDNDKNKDVRKEKSVLETHISNNIKRKKEEFDEIISIDVKETKKSKITNNEVNESKKKIQEKSNDNFGNNKDNNNDSDDNDDSSEDDDDDEKDDFRDLRQSDGSDEEIEDNSETIGSFFDLRFSEGDHLKELLMGKTPTQQATALQQLIKNYDPSLAENNKELLSRLYAHLLQYIHEIFSNLKEEAEIIKSFLIFNKLVPFFYDLVHLNKVSTKKYIVELLKEKHDKFKRNPKKVPDLDTLVFFKLISILYPTSDFRHPVTTPSLCFMAEILTLSRFRDAQSISRGFFIVALVLEYTFLSKRYVPSALNFLRGIFYLCANTSILNPIQVVPPFRLHKDDVKILNLESDCSNTDVDLKMVAKDLVLTDVNDDFKIRCLYNAVSMLREFFDNYLEIEALNAIFEPHVQLLGRIDVDLYPKKVRQKISEVLQYIKQNLEVKTYTQMSREKVRPKALRLYEPEIQDVFTGSKSSKLSRENAEKARLQNKYKKEMKGALREIRRDKSYIASVKIRQKIQSDNIRKEKVKQIYKDASIQQGELNKIKRMK